MISASSSPRRALFLWFVVASIVVHAIVALLFPSWLRDLIVPKGSPTLTTIVELERPLPKPTASPAPSRQIQQQHAAPGTETHHELARETATAPPQPPPLPPQRTHVTTPSIGRDQAAFAKEVAELNKENDPHAIATIAPNSSDSTSKSYSMTFGEEHGTGWIYPTQRWKVGSADCYYGRYEYTYPNGTQEEGAIVWPFCFDADTDPFKLPPHPMPFPFPMTGFVLPRGTTLPPLEKNVYEEWANGP